MSAQGLSAQGLSAQGRTKRAVVVGGGIAGLGTAALLARDGFDVTLLEARDQVGGRAGLWRKDGFTFDTGPSWYLMPDVFDHFFRLLGTTTEEQLELVRLDPGYRVFFEDAAPVDIAGDLESNVATFEQIERGAGQRLRAYLESARDAYTMAVRRFLYTTYASVLPVASGDVLARLPRLARLLTRNLEDHVAAQFRDRRLQQVLGYPAVFLGSSPRLTPSMYHLMSHLDLADGVLYPQGGFSVLIDRIRALAEQEGVEIRTGARVVTITTADQMQHPLGALVGTLGGAAPLARVTGVEYRDDDGVLHDVPADVVVSTADLHQTETALLPERLRTHPRSWWDKRTPGPSAVLLYLGVRGRLPQLEHHSLFFTNDWQAGFDRIFPEGGGPVPPGSASARPFPDPASLYVCRPSATDPSVAPADHENLFVLVPVPADPQLGRGGEDGTGAPWVEAVADAAIAQIALWADIPDLADRVVVRRTVGPADFAEDLRTWQGTALGLAHTLDQSAMFRAGNVAPKVAGLLLAGSSTIPGIGLPMCLISAELVVKRLRGDTSTGPMAEPLDSRRPAHARPSGAAQVREGQPVA